MHVLSEAKSRFYSKDLGFTPKYVVLMKSMWKTPASDIKGYLEDVGPTKAIMTVNETAIFFADEEAAIHFKLTFDYKEPFRHDW